VRTILRSSTRAQLALQILLWGTLGLLAFCPRAASAQSSPSPAQQPSSSPYARIADQPPQYRGPDRGAEEDINTEVVSFGLLVPLEGPQGEAGRALQLAAEIALEEANREGGYRGRHFALQTRSTSVPWGKASGEVVRLIYSDQVVALVTSMEGATAHLAEQVANKAGAPVLSLAPDPTTTEINLPWIFRFVPSDREQAEALAEELYGRRGFTKVALVAQDNRDARLGAAAFRAAAPEPGAVVALPLAEKPAAADVGLLLGRFKQERVQALVLWAEPAAAGRVVRQLRESGSELEVYLSVAAAQPPFLTACGGCGGVHVIAPASEAPAPGSESFVATYTARSGRAPTAAASATFGCIRLLARAVKAVGPNRARVRDYLAASPHDSDGAGQVAFDSEGNLKSRWRVRALEPAQGRSR
jgi:branched-chain amino acid transport system substrate-binding protein